MIYEITQWIIITGSIGIYAIVISIYCVLMNRSERIKKIIHSTNKPSYKYISDSDDDWNVL